jgi:hypothetical protein
MQSPDTIRKRLRKKGVSALKKILWKDFALWVKLNWSSDGKNVNCFTCEKPMFIGDPACQGGHWLSKAAYSVHYFNENNVRPQCASCNLFYQGEGEAFRRALELEIGSDAVNEIYETRFDKWKPTRDWYIDQIIYYRNEIHELKERFGL